MDLSEDFSYLPERQSFYVGAMPNSSPTHKDSVAVECLREEMIKAKKQKQRGRRSSIFSTAFHKLQLTL